MAFVNVFGRCILPKAVTPLQKTICGLTGITVLGGTIAGCGYGGIKAVPYIIAHSPTITIPDIFPKSEPTKISEGEKEDPIFIKTFKKIETNLTNIYEKPVVKYYISPFILGASFGFGTFLMGVNVYMVSEEFYGISKLFKEEIKGTTECCNIMRSTMRYTIKTPFYGIAISATMIICLGAGFISGVNFLELGSNVLNAKQILNRDGDND